MPERQNKQFRVEPSDDVMGEGSWVKFKSLSFGDILPLLTGDEVPNSKNLSGPQLAKLALGILPAIVDDWNWVDDEGGPLKLDADVINALPYQEQTWLIENSGLREVLNTKN